MRPLSLMIEGFTCFKDRQGPIDFSALDLFAICGPTGAGKSSILDAIIFALYGKVPRMGGKGLTELISLGRDRMAVVLDFSVGAESYRIVRRIRRRGTGEVHLEQIVNGSEHSVAAGVREVEERIQQLLGLRYDAFTQAVVLPQGEFQRFLKSQPRDRREILRDLLRLQVYERMRKLAYDEQARLWGRLQNLQERLQQEYVGVTSESLTQQRQSLKHLAEKNEHAANNLKGLESELVDLRLCFEKTTELNVKRNEANKLLNRESEIHELSERLNAATRATAVVPLVETAVSQEKAATEEAKRARDAIVTLETAKENQTATQADLLKAETAAALIPRLRERVGKLDELKGVIDARNGAAKRKAEAEKQEQRFQRDLTELERDHKSASGKVRDADKLLKNATVVAERILYDKKLDARLDSAREKATKLATQREALQEEQFEAKELALELEKKQSAAASFEMSAERAATALARREENWKRADKIQREAEQRHAAAVLREGIELGDTCPVCDQPVAKLPQKHKVVELEKLAAEFNQAREAFERAKAAADTARTAATQATSAAVECKKAVDAACKKVEHRVKDVGKQEAELVEQVGTDVQKDKSKNIEQRVLVAAQKLAEVRKLFEQATETRRQAEQALQREQHQEAQLTTKISACKDRIAETAAQIRRSQEEIAALTAQIQKVTKEADPFAERKRLTGEVDGIEKQLKAAQAAERTAGSQLAAAERGLQESQRAAERAKDAAAKARKKVHDAALEAGFSDETIAAEAALPLTKRRELENEIKSYQRERHAVEQRVQNLETDLKGETVSEEEYQNAVQRVSKAREAYEQGIREEATSKKTVEDLQRRLKIAKQLSEEMQTTSTTHRVYKQLAEDLRSERFQAYLLEEAFHELVQGASERLMKLSGRYTFDYRDDAFYVLDHDNAQEQRSTDTLSGGETFLASLSLALELSQQVQRAAGAVNLDSLFIDEGFGTLDTETLDTVASAIESLRVGGRMVGIITHIPELTMRLPERIIVEKRADGSRVHSEAN